MADPLSPADLDALEAWLREPQFTKRFNAMDWIARCPLREIIDLSTEVRRLREVLGAIAVDPLTLVDMHEEPLRGWAVCCAQIAADALNGGDND